MSAPAELRNWCQMNWIKRGSASSFLARVYSKKSLLIPPLVCNTIVKIKQNLSRSAILEVILSFLPSIYLYID